LTVEYEKAKAAYRTAKNKMSETETAIGRELPMLAEPHMDLGGLVTLKRCLLVEENVVGVRLPQLKAIEVDVAPYSKITTPPWLDQLVMRLRDACEGRVRLDVAVKRISILGKSLRQITQRVNLFERILIPQALENIRRIRIFLGDIERDAVVRSKLAQSRNIPVAAAEDAT
jgi:V/A-type H+-transporting ATPase subunit D